MAFQPNDPNAARDRANMMFAVIISLFILLGFHFFVEMPRQQKLAEEAKVKAAAEKTEAAAKADPAGAKPTTEDTLAAGTAPAAEAKRITIRGARLSGSMPTTGGRIDDLTLNEHFTTVENKEHVALLKKQDAPQTAYVDSGWLGDGLRLPDEKTVWSVAPGSPPEITSGGAPVILTWDNGQGLKFERSISLDENFLFTIRQTVRNTGTAEVKLRAYHAFARRGVPPDFTG
ncbi:MAG TPA: membrane protein insertase YidC, partial [Patescibacteria group bacterium]|nr:membrane protein insertase YidC [Patescibacteria group bacterium]